MKEITITLKRSEIVSDVVSTAHIVGRRLNVPGNEEKAAADRKADKVATLTYILDEIIEFVEEFYPELIVDEDLEITPEDVENVIEVLDVYTPKFKELQESLANLEASTSKPSPSLKKELPVSFKIDDNPINTFLKVNGLL